MKVSKRINYLFVLFTLLLLYASLSLAVAENYLGHFQATKDDKTDIGVNVFIDVTKVKDVYVISKASLVWTTRSKHKPTVLIPKTLVFAKNSSKRWELVEMSDLMAPPIWGLVYRKDLTVQADDQDTEVWAFRGTLDQYYKALTFNGRFIPDRLDLSDDEFRQIFGNTTDYKIAIAKSKTQDIEMQSTTN